MNRPGPQTMRGLPNGGFPSQQRLQENRRITPSGKLAGNGATWAFGGGPMGGAGLGNSRPGVPMTSFAQTAGGASQSSAPLDPADFPSLSTNLPQPSQSTWATASSGSRNLGLSANLRLQQSAGLSSQAQIQQQQQDDLFNTSSQLPSSQGAFRFGSQSAVGESSQPSRPDEFPPLNRNANGEIGQDRITNLLGVGFGTSENGASFGASNPPQQARSNGLLSALSESTRVPNRRSSPAASMTGGSVTDQGRQSLSGAESDAFANFGANNPNVNRNDEDAQQIAMSIPPSRSDGLAQQGEGALSQAHGLTNSSPSSNAEDSRDVEDPLAHMQDIDKWGLKGFSFLMNNYPDYNALVNGSEVNNIGFDLSSPEPYTPQIFSLWDTEPARPDVPKFNLPECYSVHNIAALDSKLPSFNDEALIFMFYSNPGDLHQMMAAQELHNRNWRYHKKLQVWLTKDEMMVPQALGQGREQGYYIFFDIKQWQRERREFTLVYDDLENIPARPPGA